MLKLCRWCDREQGQCLPQLLWEAHKVPITLWLVPPEAWGGERLLQEASYFRRVFSTTCLVCDSFTLKGLRGDGMSYRYSNDCGGAASVFSKKYVVRHLPDSRPSFGLSVFQLAVRADLPLLLNLHVESNLPRYAGCMCKLADVSRSRTLI